MAAPAAAPSNPFDKFGVALEKMAKVAGQAQTGLTSMFASLERSLNSLGTQFTRFVGLTNPAAVMRFNLALKDTQATIGQILLPVLERFTGYIRRIGDAIINLSDGTKRLLGGLAAGAALAAAFVGVAKAAAVLLGVLGSGPLLIGALAAGLVGASQTVASLAPLGDAIRALVVAVVEAVKPLVSGLVSVVVPVLQAFAGVLTVVARVLGGVFEILAPFAEVLREVLYLVGSLLEGLVKLAAELGEGLLKLITGDAVNAIKVFTDTIREFVAFLRKVVNTVRGWMGLAPIVDEPKKKDKSSVGAAVRETSIGGLQELINKMYASAYMMTAGSGQDVPKQQLSAQERIRDAVEKMAARQDDPNRLNSKRPARVDVPENRQTAANDGVRDQQRARFD